MDKIHIELHELKQLVEETALEDFFQVLKWCSRLRLLYTLCQWLLKKVKAWRSAKETKPSSSKQSQ